MGRQDRARFFDGVKEHSQIKLRAFERYLEPWAAKVGSRSDVTRIWVVDGFAGAGRYGSGELGSPGLALELARSTVAKGRSYKVTGFFVERDVANFNALRRLRAEYDVEAFVEHGDFWSKTKTVIELVAADPVFLFVDPFGLGDLKFAALAELCDQLKQVDLMVNVASPAAKRLAPGQPRLIDEAVGGPGWTLDTVTTTFASRIRAACNFLPPAVLPVQDTLGGLKYDLVMAARHPAAYELWNDEIARGDRAILDGVDGDEKDYLLRTATDMLRESGAPRRSFSRDRLIRDLSVASCGEFHRRTYIRAAESLVASGEWLRASGPVGTATITPTR